VPTGVPEGRSHGASVGVDGPLAAAGLQPQPCGEPGAFAVTRFGVRLWVAYPACPFDISAPEVICRREAQRPYDARCLLLYSPSPGYSSLAWRILRALVTLEEGHGVYLSVPSST